MGLLLAGLSFVPLALAAQQVGASGQMARVWWLVLAYLVLEAGEMCLSPVGLSAATQLAVPRVVSLMMGIWFLATALLRSAGRAVRQARRDRRARRRSAEPSPTPPPSTRTCSG